MSKYKAIETAFTSREQLIAAIKECYGDVVEVHEVGKGVNLFGYSGDRRQEKADIIVRRAHIEDAANDLGFVTREDGKIDVVISEFDQTSVAASMVRNVTQTYAVNGAIAAAKKKGLKVAEKTRVNGKVYVKLRGYR